jgi:hypothetical protein
MFISNHTHVDSSYEILAESTQQQQEARPTAAMVLSSRLHAHAS